MNEHDGKGRTLDLERTRWVNDRLPDRGLYRTLIPLPSGKVAIAIKHVRFPSLPINDSLGICRCTVHRGRGGASEKPDTQWNKET